MKTEGKRRCSTCHDWFEPTLDNFHSNGADGRLRGSCKSCRNARQRGEKIAPPEITPFETIKKSDRYVITYAQNATPVNQDFFDSLKHYCKFNDAQLVVIAGRYKNPTSIWTSNMEHDDWWAPELKQFLLGGDHRVNENIIIHGRMSIQPTARRPLSGLEVYAGRASGIFGHPKLQLKMVATDNMKWPRQLLTTGAVTIRNYTPTKAGLHGAAHHVFGAIVVERDGKTFHTRQINAEDDTGCFYELEYYYTPDGVEEYVEKDGGVEAIVFGDVHAAKPDKDVLNATFHAKDSLVNVLRPKTCVYHDVHDHSSRNHHNRNNFHDLYARMHGDKINLVEEELKITSSFIDEITPKWAKPVVVQSNHDDAFDRWLAEVDIRKDPLNAKLFHEMQYKLLEHYDKHKKFVPAFEFWYTMRGQGRAQFIRRGEEFKIANIACSFHGDKGPNGSRGSVIGYAQLGVKTIVGHYHTPAILDGCYVVGILGNKNQGYNVDGSPSSWFHTNCVIYPNGKRSLVSIVNGCWRL